MLQAFIGRIGDESLVQQPLELGAHVPIRLGMSLELWQILLYCLVFQKYVQDQPRDFLRDQLQPAFRFLAARVELRFIARQWIVQAAAIECRRQYLLLQFLLGAERKEQHAQFLRIGQVFLHILHLFFQQQHEQSAQAAAMRCPSRLTGIERAKHHCIALIHQRVVQRDILSRALNHARLGKVAEIPRGVTLFRSRFSFHLFCRNGHGDDTRRMLGMQLSEIARHAELTTVLVHNSKIHHQVLRQLLEAERIQWYVDLLLLTDVARQRLQQGIIGWLYFATECCCEFRHRHQMAPQFLRQ